MCTTFIAKLVLGIINSVVFLVGLIMFIVGLVIYTQPDFSREALSDLLDKVKQASETAGFDVKTEDFSVADVAYSFVIPIIVIGIFLAGIAVLGIIGVKYGIKIILIVYFIITLVLFLAQVILVLIAVIDRDVFDDAVKPRLKDTIHEYFEGINSNDPTSQIWNGIMLELECCGVDNYKDFDEATKWRTGFATTYSLQTPVACCQNVTSNPYPCAVSPTDANNNWKTGCYTKMWDYLISNSGIVIGIATGVLLAQLLILLLTCIIMNSSGKVGSIV